MNSSRPRRLPLRDRFYRILLRLYPAEVRAQDGQAMLELFSDL